MSRLPRSNVSGRILLVLMLSVLVCGLTTSADAQASLPGQWTKTGDMLEGRGLHTATLLPNGKVLVAGGCIDECVYDGRGATNNTELYDPATGLWAWAESMGTARHSHTATLLNNGKVLVVGGVDIQFDGQKNIYNVTAGAELYDQNTNKWTATGSLVTARFQHSATLLPNGQVLVAGGRIFNSGMYTDLSKAELYDPLSGLWKETGSMAVARNSHSATLLPNGKVLVVGGASSAACTSAELYDPGTGTWAPANKPAVYHFWPVATRLLNGKVLVAGTGFELYDPDTNSWSVTGNMSYQPEKWFPATLMPDGKVLVAGGFWGTRYLSGSELYDPATGQWTKMGEMTRGRWFHTATLLPSGKVLVTGDLFHTTSAELYDPQGYLFLPLIR